MSLIPSSDSDRSVRQQRHSYTETSLPEDLVIDILLRVPAQTIFVFGGVSKYCRDLTKSGEFTRKHYEVSKGTRPSILLHRRIYCGISNASNSVVIRLDFESGCKVDEFMPPVKEEGKDFHFLGCQRGILCYNLEVNNLNNLIFWNPITKVGRRSRCVDTITRPNSSRVRYFFGYDHVTDDFKVLKITRFLGHRHDYDCVVYSSKADSWKRTQGFDHIRNGGGNGLNLDMGYRGAEVFVEGSNFNCVHMIARFGLLGGGQVLAYDFMAEKFKLVPFPKLRSLSPKSNLSSVNGRLCLLLMPCYGGLEGWIMNDYEDGKSWTTLFSMKPDSIPSFIHKPLSVGLVVINGSPHLLIQSDCRTTGTHQLESELYIYDVSRKQFKKDDDVHKTPLSRVLQSHCICQHFQFVPSHRKP